MKNGELLYIKRLHQHLRRMTHGNWFLDQKERSQ